MTIQSIMFDGRRKLGMTHISMGIANHGIGYQYRETHTRWDRFVYVMEGKGMFELQNKRLQVRKGDVLFLPAGSSYFSYWNQNASRIGVINVELYDEQEDSVIHFGDQASLLFNDENGTYLSVMEEIERKQNAGEPYYCLERLGNAAKLVCDIMREQSRSQYETKMRRIYNGVNHLEKNLRDNSSVQQLAALCGLSAGGFRRLFYECKGMSPVDYRNSLRVRRAAEILKEGKYSVGEVAEMVGVYDSKYFTKIFKRYTGHLPSQVRQKKTEDEEILE